MDVFCAACHGGTTNSTHTIRSRYKAQMEFVILAINILIAILILILIINLILNVFLIPILIFVHLILSLMSSFN
jgi:hypothetical protein